jgi:mRNA-degrading endonuclease HigB of HigAB toxin-antitoxin module
MRVIALSTLKAFWETNPSCIYIRFLGTHSQYDQIDAQKV